jgi:hypothetical protein
MQVDRTVYRDSIFFFAVVTAVIVWGFWPSYYAHPWQALPATRYHIHGAAMTAWLLMLLAQAYLIRSNRRALHRQLGKASYLLAPLMVAMFVVMVKGSATMQGLIDTHQDRLLQAFLFYSLGKVVLFACFYVLAMLNRHAPAAHARYMACTLLPLYAEGTDRLIAPRYGLLATSWGWFAGDLVLLALAIWDWRSGRRFGPFTVALAVMIVYHALLFATPLGLPGWAAFTDWFVSL